MDKEREKKIVEVIFGRWIYTSLCAPGVILKKERKKERKEAQQQSRCLRSSRLRIATRSEV